VRTKLLLAALPLGLATAALTGCGNANSAAHSNTVAQLADTMAITQKSGLGLEDADRHYSVDHDHQGWTIPGDPSPAAEKQDELNALVDEIQAAHTAANGSPEQQAVLARMLADIHLSEARYLGGVAQNSYEHARSRATDLQPYADKINAIQGLITILKGDRELIIETLQTGNTGGAVDIDGINQLQERADAIQARLDEATAAYEEYEAQAQELADTVLEFEQAELELKTESRTQTGDPQFDTLDRAVEAWLKARLAEIEAEYNALLGSAERQNADLNAADLVQVQSVIEHLEQGIASVRDDIDSLRSKVNDAQTERNSAANELADAYDTVDARMEALVFLRLELAATRAGEAVAHFQSITTTGQARNAMRREQLSAMLIQLGLMQQHAVSLSGYKAAIDTLAANGEEVLGASLANTLANRSSALGAEVAAIQAASEALITAASDLSSELVRDFSGDTAVAETLSRQNEHLQAIESTLGELPY